ncbi:MAG: hypothetical protein EXQ47_07070 [Bryobacterales bacterium]|nr:hypothetical protein [Bryobacterales bacterium]
MRIRISQILCLLAASVVAFAQGNSDNVRNLNNRVLQFHSAIQRANAAEAAQIRAQAGAVLAERAAALTALIREDPNAALGLAFAQELLADLATRFPGSASSLEQQGTWTGASDHLIFDDPARQVRRYQVSINAGNSNIEVYSAGDEPHCVSGDSLSATGVRVNNVVAAGSTSVSASAAAGATCSTLGPQNSAVILIQFPGYPLPSTVTPTAVNDIFFANSGKSVNTYWKEASYQQASATGQVFGPYSLDTVYTCDQYSAMRTAAIAAADAEANFTQFTRVFIVFPSPGGCAWAGLGTLGCGTLSSADGNFQASTSWLLATYMGGVDNGVKLATHEGGHNLTLHHSSSRDFAAEAVGPLGMVGTLSEYGDTHSTMGSWNFGHYPAPHKVQIGWLPSSNVTTVETTGSHTILPFENTVLGVQALKVRRGTGGSTWLWLEYRQPIGLYDSTLNTQVHTGALVHMQDSSTGTHTHLVDFTTGTSSFSDAALAAAWTDPYTNVSLAVTGANASGLSVDVGFGALTCNSRVQPAVVITPDNPTVMAGTNYNFSVAVTNYDPLGCGNSTFNLGSLLPSGWTTSFSLASVTLAPGQTLYATMSKSVPAGVTPGTYALDAIASDASHSATGTNNITVIASTCTNVAPTVTLSPSAASLLRGASQNFTLSVKNNDASPCASRTFNLTSLLPSGWTSSLSASSLALAVGATGTATLSKTVPMDAAFTQTTVNGTASDALSTGAANATITVVEPIAVSLATSATSVAARSTVTLTATVTKAGGAPAAGATVTFSITRGSIGTTTKSVVANSSGVATYSYKAQQKGSYTAVSTASLSGATATSNTVTFTAN